LWNNFLEFKSFKKSRNSGFEIEIEDLKIRIPDWKITKS
jgi:hypothetical protein